MALKSKKAKFFCENCGEEVPKDAKMCRHCGRFFSSVRCPQCGENGSPEKFSNGCPVCGYSTGNISRKSGASLFKNRKASRTSKKALLSAINERYDSINGVSQSQDNSDESLPWWLYFIIFSILFFIVFLFFRLF